MRNTSPIALVALAWSFLVSFVIAVDQMPMVGPPRCQDDECRKSIEWPFPEVPYPKKPGKRRTFPGLYQRQYSEVTWIGTHDAAFVRTERNHWSPAGNQYFNLTTQLESGVRLIQAQGHPDPWGGPLVRLCHTSCGLFDGGSLDDFLLEAAAWLERNPREVLTFLWVNAGAPLEHWAEAYRRAGLDLQSYIPPRDKLRGRMRIRDWPSLDELAVRGTRVVSFLSAGADEYRVPWLLNEFHYMFETAYLNDRPADFDCEVDRPRGTPSPVVPERLTLVNHFLYAEWFGVRYPNASFANFTNAAGPNKGMLGEHAARCRKRYGRRPNFLLVDFFNEGDVFDVEYDMNACD